MAKKNGNGKADKAADKRDEFPLPKVESFTRSLRCDLKADEIAERADRAATLIAERDAKDEEQRAAAKHAKSVIETIDAEIRSLSNQVRTKATYRDVPCERVKDLRLKKIIEKRCDTGEVLFERALTEAECQAELDFPDAKPGDLDADFDEPPSAGA